jgi:hypothetical protein
MPPVRYRTTSSQVVDGIYAQFRRVHQAMKLAMRYLTTPQVVAIN